MSELILIILEQTFIYLPLIIGAYLSFSLLKIPNLSIESAFVTGAIFASKALAFCATYNADLSAPLILALAIASSIIGGAFVGLIVHIIQSQGQVPHLLSSILTLGIFYGVNLYLLGAGNKSLSDLQNPLLNLSIFQTHPEFISLALVSITVFISIFLLFKTQIGYCTAIYGNNPDFFSHHGISQKFVSGFGIITSNALAGVSGYLSAQTSSFVDINSGNGVSLFCITALILGKSVFNEKINISILIPLIGIIFYCSLQQILVKVGFSLKYFALIQSIIVLGILIVKYKNQASNRSNTDMLGL